jgi:hypothetical protein
MRSASTNTFYNYYPDYPTEARSNISPSNIDKTCDITDMPLIFHDDFCVFERCILLNQVAGTGQCEAVNEWQPLIPCRILFPESLPTQSLCTPVSQYEPNHMLSGSPSRQCTCNLNSRWHFFRIYCSQPVPG